MAPFEALYGRRCRSPICWDEYSESVTLGPTMLEEMTEQVKMIAKSLRWHKIDRNPMLILREDMMNLLWGIMYF